MYLDSGRLLIFNSNEDVAMEDKSDLNDWHDRLISGETLARRITERNGFDPALTSDEAVEVARKLAYSRTKD